MKYSIKSLGGKDKWGKPSKSQMKLQEFDSIHELVQYVDKNPTNAIFDGKELSSTRTDNSRNPWSGTTTWDEAMDLLGSGWSTMAKKLSKRVPTVSKSMATNKSRPNYSVVGGQASVPRYLQGIPTSMIDRKPVIQKQKIIVINKDAGYHAGIGVKEIEDEGVKALQIIQALEGKGYRVKLNMCFASQSGSELIGMRVTVKKPEERLSLNKIAFPIAHPSMLRRVCLRFLEVFPDMTERGYTWGHGSPSTAKMKQALDSKEIFLPNFIPDVDKFVEGLGL